MQFSKAHKIVVMHKSELNNNADDLSIGDDLRHCIKVDRRVVERSNIAVVYEGNAINILKYKDIKEITDLDSLSIITDLIRLNKVRPLAITEKFGEIFD